MNLLVCSSYLEAWNSVRPEAEIFIGIAKLGHHVTIITQREAPYAKRFIENGIEVIDGHPQAKLSQTTIKLIRRVISERQIDVVYAMDSKTIANAAMACISRDVKFVTYRGTVSGAYRHDPTSYLTHLHPRVDGIICQANAVRDYMRGQVWRNIKIETVYKGQDVAWFETVDPTDLTEFGIPGNSVVVLCVANARPSKGIPSLLGATHHLAHLDNLHLLVVGRNVDTNEHKLLAKKSPMAERIHLSSHRLDIPNLMAAADIYVQPSISGEGLSKAVPESMANRIPAIVTTTGGMKELIDDGKTGYTVPVKDPEAMASRIEYLHRNPELCSEMGKAARQRLEEVFTTKKSVEGHIKFFEELLSESKKVS